MSVLVNCRPTIRVTNSFNDSGLESGQTSLAAFTAIACLALVVLVDMVALPQFVQSLDTVRELGVPPANCEPVVQPAQENAATINHLEIEISIIADLIYLAKLACKCMLPIGPQLTFRMLLIERRHRSIGFSLRSMVE